MMLSSVDPIGGRSRVMRSSSRGLVPQPNSENANTFTPGKMLKPGSSNVNVNKRRGLSSTSTRRTFGDISNRDPNQDNSRVHNSNIKNTSFHNNGKSTVKKPSKKTQLNTTNASKSVTFHSDTSFTLNKVINNSNINSARKSSKVQQQKSVTKPKSSSSSSFSQSFNLLTPSLKMTSRGKTPKQSFTLPRSLANNRGDNSARLQRSTRNRIEAPKICSVEPIELSAGRTWREEESDDDSVGSFSFEGCLDNLPKSSFSRASSSLPLKTKAKDDILAQEISNFIQKNDSSSLVEDVDDLMKTISEVDDLWEKEYLDCGEVSSDEGEDHGPLFDLDDLSI